MTDNYCDWERKHEFIYIDTKTIDSHLVTTIKYLPTTLNLKDIAKKIKKELHCEVKIINDKPGETMLHVQGDKKFECKSFLISLGGEKEYIRIRNVDAFVCTYEQVPQHTGQCFCCKYEHVHKVDGKTKYFK